MSPPFKITPGIASLLSEITYLLGQAQASGLNPPSPKLRRENKILTIQSTLAIEGNNLSSKKITEILDGKGVLGEENEILEVKNAIKLYETLEKQNHESIQSLLTSHKILMKSLIIDAGTFRKKNVGVLKGNKISHLAPQHKLVPQLVEDLFVWNKNDADTHPIIKSCILHYELEFIHPFQDGNGRIGRFWQSLTLTNYNSLFKYLPIESLIKLKQTEYYKSLETSDKLGESTPFIEFMLQLILKSLETFTQETTTNLNSLKQRLAVASNHFLNDSFSKKDYHKLIPHVSPATASRDLKKGLTQNLLISFGKGNKTTYRFKS